MGDAQRLLQIEELPSKDGFFPRHVLTTHHFTGYIFYQQSGQSTLCTNALRVKEFTLT